jgi:tetratricopeptide (TPR) repeat protein
MPHYFLHISLVTMFLCGLELPAGAVQWQPLSGTARYKVAYDEQSVRLTSEGRLEVWLRFTPWGESERKSAAAEYKEKRYRSHLEYYEIDCGDQTALLGLIDIMGPSRTRAKRLRGGTEPAPIVPGSVLDNVAQHICPVLDEDTEANSDTPDTESPEPADSAKGSSINRDTLLRIEALQKATATPEASADTWKELGNLYFDTDQAEQAIKAYDQALALRPNDTDILNDQGAMYRQTGDFERALVNFEKAFSIDPHNLESLYNSGYVYGFDMNNMPKALTLWRRYLELDSKSDTAQQVQSFVERYGK